MQTKGLNIGTQRTIQNVNVTFERDLLKRLRAVGMNLSQTPTAIIDTELREHEAARWKEDNA